EAFLKQVEARFRQGGSPVEEAVPQPLPAVATSAPLVGEADEDGLVRAIWADPFDETARLVYADRLEEQGKPVHGAILRPPRGERRELSIQLAEILREDAPCKFERWVVADGLVGVKIQARGLRSKRFEKEGAAWLRRHHVAEVIVEGGTSDWAALL